MSVMPASKLTFHELVENIEVNVAEKLRGEVSYRQAATFRAVKQALVMRQFVPFAFRTDEPALSCRI